jgi:hypothetical protein
MFVKVAADRLLPIEFFSSQCGDTAKIIETSGVYYKHMKIVNDDSSVVSKWSSEQIDVARVVIYDRNMFIIQATGLITPYYPVCLKRLAKGLFTRMSDFTWSLQVY